MLLGIQTIRGIGQFHAVTAGPATCFGRLTLIYADNGAGKTTLSAILRSLSTGDVLPICQRAQLRSAAPPEVLLDCAGEPPQVWYHNDRWSSTLPEIVLFDDAFVEQNIYTGLQVSSENRQHLHELIIGGEGVELAAEFSKRTEIITEINKEMLARSRAIPESVRGSFTMEAFCALPARTDLERALREAERQVEALANAEKVVSTPRFHQIALPALDIQAIETLLGQGLPELEAGAVAGIQAHCHRLGEDGEQWVASGMTKLDAMVEPDGVQSCPFCGQPIAHAPLIEQYQSYFKHAYRDLKQQIDASIARLAITFGGDALATFQQGMQQTIALQQFWSKLCAVPEITITATVADAWRAAREAVLALLQAKQQAPLEPMHLDDQASAAIDRYTLIRKTVAELDRGLQQANLLVEGVKAKAARGNAAGANREMAMLRATSMRYTPEYAPFCDEYLELKGAKEEAEGKKAEVRRDLDKHRDAIFPAYQKNINQYLGQFNAGFRIVDFKAIQPGGRTSTSYHLVINDAKVPLDAGKSAADPSFKSTLSAGDRNTLALAFFFASLKNDQHLADRIVVIDDPVSALDEHREAKTAQFISYLAGHTAQVIVMSHHKSFLQQIWESSDKDQMAALEIKRTPDGSVFDCWQV